MLNAAAPAILTKRNSDAPALCVDENRLLLRAGTVIEADGKRIEIGDDTPVSFGITEPGTDFVVHVDEQGRAAAHAPADDGSGVVIGGGHFAPGGNARGRQGGDDAPQINPYSLWDCYFRPACADPSGMALVAGRFWADIYLLGAKHHECGTSRYGVEIADGQTPPTKVDGDGVYDRFNWHTANEVLAYHGKTLLSVVDFFDAAFGVTEETCAGRDPRITGLDAPRTSKWGLMQATGNMWTWGHDGDPDKQHAYIFGGNWGSGANAGSRASYWGVYPWASSSSIGARGRSDHLNPANSPR